jgi:hypothetical protein
MFGAANRQPLPREFALDPSPPQRVGDVARRQRPESMKVVRQEDNRHDVNRQALETSPHRTS